MAMTSRSRRSEIPMFEKEKNVKKIVLVLLCLLMITAMSFGQLNDFEMPDTSMHLLLVEEQQVAIGNNVSMNTAIETIELAAIEAVLVSTLYALTYNMFSDADKQRTLGFSQEHTTFNTDIPENRFGLGGVAVRLKGPMCSTSSVHNMFRQAAI